MNLNNQVLTTETKEFITAHRNEDTRLLALQAKRYPAVDMREAVVQIEGWQQAREKLPAWAATEGIIYPPKISMEQCSSEHTAKYKASLLSGGRFADLTGGFGIDFSYIARGFSEAFYVERNERLCYIARANFALLGLDHARVMHGNSEELLAALPQLDWLFVDPARRDGDGRKVVALSDCEPNVVELEDKLLSKASKVMIKCSPMLDISLACRQLSNVEAVHVVAVNNECKELLIVLGKANDDIPVHCVDIREKGTLSFSYTMGEEQQAECRLANEVAGYLYEPCAALQKAGCYNSLSARFEMAKLHPNSQLYTADALVPDFPGRVFEVIEVLGFSKAEIKKIQALQKANITVRNFPENVQLLRKRLKLADGGDNYIFATTLAKGEKVLVVCKKAI
ncbi:MAG: SAM-dependent methyltransferase [Bacteroidaceae bacterium]|nr:SAM-dependent methyltransferase [Bacteroidaceae bacterium]